jgi:DHA1 family tetracycline resistance protein-like MFS transporter
MKVVRPHTASVAFILATLGIDALGFGIVIPIVPALVRSLSHLDASEAARWVGALVATFAAAQFVAAPVLGGLSDRFGRRPVIILSLLGGAANYMLLAFAPSLTWLFIGRLLAGSTAANVSAANAYIADVTPPELRSQRFGLVGAMFGAGFVFGPALGGVLGAVDLRLPFLVAGALALANATYGALVLPESLPPERRRHFSWRRANPIGSLHTIATDKPVARMALAWCCMWFGLGALQSCFVLSMGLRFGWGPSANGWALAAMGVSQAVVQGVLVRPIIRRVGERRAAFIGFGLSGLAYLGYGLATAGWVIYVALILQALAAIATPAMRALLSVQAGSARQGEMQGGLSSVEGLTAIISPVLAAALFEWATQTGGAAWGGAPFLLGTVAYGAAVIALARA